MPPASSFAGAGDGAALWYDDWGGEGQPIIFLHGFTAYRRNWGHGQGGAAWLLARAGVAPPGSSKGSGAGGPSDREGLYRAIFLESRGCGRGASAGAPGPYTIEQQALDVLALADHLGLPVFTFAGHSMGGGVGFQLCATVPGRLTRCVLMAPIPADGLPSGGNVHDRGAVQCIHGRRSVRFHLLLCTYDAPPCGPSVRVDEPTGPIPKPTHARFTRPLCQG